jgi:hypothetical protein
MWHSGQTAPLAGRLDASQARRYLMWPDASEPASDDAVMAKPWRDSATFVCLPGTHTRSVANREPRASCAASRGVSITMQDSLRASPASSRPPRARRGPSERTVGQVRCL